MTVTAIVGAQWGDEGKGKITDLLAQDADIVIRYGGGGNAGHTVVNERGEFKLHLVPCGIFNPQAIALAGTGTVVDFDFLREELASLESGGISTGGLRISSRAHVVMPYHLVLDRVGDEARGSAAVGTTRRGVGPTYVDKADRVGIQAGDILDEEVLRRKLALSLPEKNRLLTDVHGEQPFQLEELVDRARGWREQFSEIIIDQVEFVHEALVLEKTILLEGQLGALRDLDWGTYPFVTSSTTLAGGGAVGGGMPPTAIERVVGVVKAYTTSVGAGPLPSELHGAEADELRECGNEYGATTGRPRRVGWFDAVAVRYAHRLNRFSGMAVTKLDVLDGMESLKICTGYRVGEQYYSTVPTTGILENVVPVYEELEGWREPSAEAKRWQDLPPNARRYIRRIEELVGGSVTIVSVGPGRHDTVLTAA